MLEYCAEDFMGVQEPAPFEVEVEKKISLLYDLCVLHTKNHQRDDDREGAVRRLLLSYGTPLHMDNGVHDVIVGNCTLNEMLKRKGFEV
jgi:hypothetical protein